MKTSLTHEEWLTKIGLVDLGALPYLTCRKCNKDVQDISKITEWAYQYCLKCRPWDLRVQEREVQKNKFFEDKQRAKRKPVL